MPRAIWLLGVAAAVAFASAAAGEDLRVLLYETRGETRVAGARHFATRRIAPVGPPVAFAQ